MELYRRRGKRLIDVVVAALLLLLLSPIMVLLAAAVRVLNGSPVLFRQSRPGLGGEPFMLYKFRTMRDSKDASGRDLSDEDRLTRFGSFLRSTSLDELPELLNVVRGDMSLVGPRPLLSEYLALYTRRQMRRHEVRPGLTGLSQVSGRNTLEWSKRLETDVLYVDKMSLRLDLRILGLTVWHVLRRTGIAEEGHVTMGKFTGTKG